MAFNKSEIPSLLEKHKLRKTSIRTEVLALFLDKPFALSHSDIENVFGRKYDRVTIYRTLHSFEENGLLHKVPDDSGVLKYAICLDECNHEKHHDEHVHFFCNTCTHTFCLPVHIPTINLPSGYQVSGVALTVYGTCPDCKAKSQVR